MTLKLINKMRSLIIEDEPLARRRMVKLLNDNFKDIEIVGQEDSVAGSLFSVPRIYKERYLIRINSRMVPVKVSEIAYFFSANKGTWLTNKAGESYVINPSLDEISENLNPDVFFRVSRNCLVAKDAISGIIKLSGSRLRLNLEPAPKFPIEVSRARVEDFLKWMEE